jgi:hypothetical protein
VSSHIPVNKISNPRAIAELFNLYFVQIVEKLTGQNCGTHATYDKFKNKYMPTNNIH